MMSSYQKFAVGGDGIANLQELSSTEGDECVNEGMIMFKEVHRSPDEHNLA